MNSRKKVFRRGIAISLCAALCLGGVSMAYARSENQKVSASNGADAESSEIPKSETVYVFTDASGQVQKTIVSDWKKNDEDEDVYYQEEVDKELPVGISVSYKLDGEEISADKLVGKSGRVTIRFDYENMNYEMVKIGGSGGSKEKIYTPFLMVTGVIMDNEHFANVDVKNGKAINDGERTIVAAAAFPGLQDNLDLSRDKIEIPEYAEITADATDFQLSMTVTMATNSVFTDIDADSEQYMSDLDALSGDVGKLTDAMTQLIDGAASLYDGMCSLLEKTNELSDGVAKLAAGAEEMRDGAVSLNEGAEQLNSGAAELSTGLNTLSASSAQLNAGAKNVFTSLLSSATEQIQAAGVSIPQLTPENYSQILQGILDANPNGTEQIKNLKASLDSYNTFYQGLQSYTSGVDAAAVGAANLSSGAESLKEGSSKLSQASGSLFEGLQTVNGSMPALKDGITQLKDGAEELSDGLITFNKEGIQNIADLADVDLSQLSERWKATTDMAEKYSGFTSDEGVKFIYRTSEIM